jgi:hypothetical protein
MVEPTRRRIEEVVTDRARLELRYPTGLLSAVATAGRFTPG